MSEQQVLPELIATLKAAAEKATPGARYVDGECVRNSESIIILATRHRTPKAQWANDAALIAAASPENILKLLASLAQSEAERERLQGDGMKAAEELARTSRNRDKHVVTAVELMRQRDEARAELRKLSNEASGFLAMADRNTHGNTNMAVLKMRIDDARALLEPKAEPAPVATTS